MKNDSAILVHHLSKNYGERKALQQLDLEVKRGEIFCLLGPNGGGKSTLFRILSTLLRPDDGEASIVGFNVVTAAADVRARIGVVFQAPSLDAKLTVRENLLCGGALYGLKGKELRERLKEVAAAVQIEGRLDDAVEHLSGGLQRRTEIAKCLLINPEVLLLDEPSTGLDPAARLDVWAALEKLRSERGVTALCTTHLMEEAARADRVGIINEGQLVALGKPNELVSALSGDVLSLSVTGDIDLLAQEINNRHQIVANVVEGEIRIEHPQAYELAAQLAGEFPGRITSLRVARPTLEDVFIARTGRLFAGTHRDESDKRDKNNHKG